jgi:hypothetical protein
MPRSKIAIFASSWLLVWGFASGIPSTDDQGTPDSGVSVDEWHTDISLEDAGQAGKALRSNFYGYLASLANV